LSTATEDHSRPEHTWFVRWKHTWSGRVVWTIVDLAIVYAFGSLAVNSGSLWQWGVAALFLIDGLYNLIRLIGLLINAKR
jgi:hypothetical protein